MANPTGGTGEQPNQQGPQAKGAAKGQAEQQRQQGKGERGEAERQRGLARRGRGTELAPFFRMTPLTGSPFTAMRRMMEDFDRMFEDLGAGLGLGPRRGGRELEEAGGPLLWAPRVEVLERDQNLVVRADLPGLSKEDVRLTVADDALVIEGERRRETEEEREGVYRSEVAYGSFRRAIPLPEGADAEKADARFENGVLEVRIPLPKEAARGRRIEIKGGEGPAVH